MASVAHMVVAHAPHPFSSKCFTLNINLIPRKPTLTSTISLLYPFCPKSGPRVLLRREGQVLDPRRPHLLRPHLFQDWIDQESVQGEGLKTMTSLLTVSAFVLISWLFVIDKFLCPLQAIGDEIRN